MAYYLNETKSAQYYFGRCSNELLQIFLAYAPYRERDFITQAARPFEEKPGAIKSGEIERSSPLGRFGILTHF